jgi:2-octaprenyl-6-methoxyphenol hydroxylase
MKKQKICIIGGSLTGLVTAISLSKLNCEIDLIVSNINQNQTSSKTIAISQNNYDFLDKLNLFKAIEEELWPCSEMKLYTENKSSKFSEIFKLNGNETKKQKVLYMLENSKIIKHLINKIKKTKSISMISNGKINEINTSGLLKSIKLENKSNKYNLIIVCVGNNSNLVKNIFPEQTIKHSYKEKSITTILNHSSIKNNIARQIFLDKEILALLPISNTRTSIVWSVKNDLYKDNNFFIKRKIKLYAKNFLKKIKFETNIECRDLNFLIRKTYYKDRILLFGDALHVVHPLAGQGFNMTLRDLSCLENKLKNTINLGLDIGSSNTLLTYSNEIKPRNFIHSISIDLLKNFFSYKNKSFKKFRNKTIQILNKNSSLKGMFFNIADNGFKF